MHGRGILIIFILSASVVSGRFVQSLLKENAVKRLLDQNSKGNPCPEPEKPFPCRGSGTCIPMVWICDDNWDCENGYDENNELCTAANRPAVEDIYGFLEEERSWLMPALFGDHPIPKVAHGLAVSKTLEEFQRRLKLDKTHIRNLRTAFRAVHSGNEAAMEKFGMPTRAWNEVVFFFSKLIDSGFIS